MCKLRLRSEQSPEEDFCLLQQQKVFWLTLKSNFVKEENIHVVCVMSSILNSPISIRVTLVQY